MELSDEELNSFHDAETFHWLAVGATVRYTFPTRNQFSCRAIVLCVATERDADGCLLADIELIDGDRAGTEIAAASESQLRPLESFENKRPSIGLLTSIADDVASAHVEKCRGNALFKLYDCWAALNFYACALARIRRAYPPTIGATVLLTREGERKITPADVYDVLDSGSALEVGILDSGGEELCQEEVPKSCIVTSLAPPESRNLQCALHLNIARCHLKISSRMSDGGARARRAQWHCCVALATACAAPANPAFKNKAIALRSRCLLALGRVNAARRDATRAGHTETSSLGKLVAKKAESRKKVNRKLAKEIGKWVEKAMQSESKNP
jgi:hypothetical protein